VLPFVPVTLTIPGVSLDAETVHPEGVVTVTEALVTPLAETDAPEGERL
jgi:hypothetical protein